MTGGRIWLADPTVSWNVSLAAATHAPLDADAVERRVRQWDVGGEASVVGGDDLPELRARLVRDPRTVLAVGVVKDRLVVVGHHSRVDGLGLLGLLGIALGDPPVSAARGTGDRGPAGFGSAAALRRLGSALLRPPAAVVASAPSGKDSGSGDAYAALRLTAAAATADLAVAARAALPVTGSARPFTLAVGASRRTGERPEVVDDSALLRLGDIRARTTDEIQDALRVSRPEPPPVYGSTLTAAVAALGLRVLAPRLGSTLLLSHLGRVELHGVHDLEFHPVTGGGSGLALGAVTLDGRTTITLRGRSHRHSAAGLAAMLEAIAAELPGDASR